MGAEITCGVGASARHGGPARRSETPDDGAGEIAVGIRGHAAVEITGSAIRPGNGLAVNRVVVGFSPIGPAHFLDDAICAGGCVEVVVFGAPD